MSAKAALARACHGEIVAAHTIPRSHRMAPDGHVYAVAGAPVDFARTDGQLTAKKYGIRNFSVLNCFGATHDNKIFSYIEDDELVFDDHQLTLLQYRTLAVPIEGPISLPVHCVDGGPLPMGPRNVCSSDACPSRLRCLRMSAFPTSN